MYFFKTLNNIIKFITWCHKLTQSISVFRYSKKNCAICFLLPAYLPISRQVSLALGATTCILTFPKADPFLIGVLIPWLRDSLKHWSLQKGVYTPLIHYCYSVSRRIQMYGTPWLPYVNDQHYMQCSQHYMHCSHHYMQCSQHYMQCSQHYTQRSKHYMQWSQHYM